MELGSVSAKAANRHFSSPFGHGHIMNLRPHVNPGRIRVGNREFGASPVAFAFGAVPTSGLALRS